MEKLLDKENHIIPPDTPEPFPDKHAADVAVVVASLTVGDRMAMVAGKPGS